MPYTFGEWVVGEAALPREQFKRNPFFNRLMPPIDGLVPGKESVLQNNVMRWVLNLANEYHDVIDMAEKSKLPVVTL